MKDNLTNFLSLVSEETSGWLEKAKYSIKNHDWLDVSAEIAIKVLRTLRAKAMTQKELADLMNVSPQYISKIVKGGENLSLETIGKLENALGIVLIEWAVYELFVSTPYCDSSTQTVTQKIVPIIADYTEDNFQTYDLDCYQEVA